MTTITISRAIVEQALEALEEETAWFGPTPKGAAAITTLRAALAQEQAEADLQTCNCRWDGDVQVQQCTLHEAHVDAIHEWAERAKTAEKKLAALAQEPHRDLRVALQAPGCERLREWFEIGPVQRAALETFVAALTQEQAEPVQEPVAVVRWNDIGHISWRSLVMLPDDTPLYTAPPKRKPLTSDKDRPDQGATYVDGYGYVDTRVVRAVERAHGIGGSNG